MANEIQRIYFGSQASPVLTSDIESGTFTLEFNGYATSPLNYNDSAATILTALEALSSVGSGNASVTLESDGFTVEFTGSLANTNVNSLSCTNISSLAIDASNISITNTQTGVVDVTTSVSNSLSVNSQTPLNEIQQIILIGATTGTFDLNGNSTYATITVDASIVSNIQAACDSIWGSGNSSVSDIGSGTYNITFQGSYAAVDVENMWITNNTTDGSPYTNSANSGVGGLNQQDVCTFGNTPTSGSMIIDGQYLGYNTDASTLSIYGATLSGTPASGSITTTWSDYNSHTPLTMSQNDLRIAGQPQIVSVVLTENPNSGTLNVTIGAANSSDFNYYDSTPGNITDFTGGGSAGNWTYTCNANNADAMTSAYEGSNPLRKSISMEVIVTQEGVVVVGEYIHPSSNPNVNLFISFIEGF